MEDSIQTTSGSRLCACALGMGFGVVSALLVLAICVAAHFFHYGVSWVAVVSSVYVGFKLTPVGVLIGVVWAFVEGFVFGFLVGFVYNFVAKRCNCKICAK